MSTTAAESPLLTPDQAAAYLLSRPRTLERWRGEGTGPAFIRLGRRVAYRREDLEAFLEKQREQR